MTRAIRFHQAGGPEVLRWEEVDIAPPGAGEARVRHTAVGLNFIDVYHRTGLYPLPLPSGIGLEAAGVVEAIGPGVAEFAVGDRVAYAGGPIGAYAECRVIPAHRLVKLPASVAEDVAAAAMLKGMTVEYLLRRTFRVEPGQTVLFHAAAGGVGLIAGQWLRAIGATAIGTVGTDEKAELAKSYGYEHVIVYSREDVVRRVRDLTDGKGVSVVYDSVGRDTFEASLDCLRPRGMMVLFGNASGPVPPFDPGLLARKGSLFFTRPTLMTYTESRTDLLESAGALFGMIESGVVRIEIGRRYALADAESAHRDLESRRTSGSCLLLPDRA